MVHRKHQAQECVPCGNTSKVKGVCAYIVIRRNEGKDIVGSTPEHQAKLTRGKQKSFPTPLTADMFLASPRSRAVSPRMAKEEVHVTSFLWAQSPAWSKILPEVPGKPWWQSWATVYSHSSGGSVVLTLCLLVTVSSEHFLRFLLFFTTEVSSSLFVFTYPMGIMHMFGFLLLHQWLVLS